MAAASARRVKRSKAKDAADKVAAEMKDKPKTPALVPFERMIVDPQIKSANIAYKNAVSGAEALLTWASAIVKRFAKVNYGTDGKYVDWLVAQEKKIRMESRRDSHRTESVSDKRGVNASQFTGVLTFAQMDGAMRVWKIIEDNYGNWSDARRIANGARMYFNGEHKQLKSKGKWPTLPTMRKILKLSKEGAGNQKTSAKVYCERMHVALIDMRKAHSMREMGCETQYQAARDAIDELARAIKKYKKPSGTTGSKRKAATTAAAPKGKKVIDLAEYRRLLKAAKKSGRAA